MLIVLLVSYSMLVTYSIGQKSNEDFYQSKINEMNTRFERDKMELQQRMEHQQEYFERRLEEME